MTAKRTALHDTVEFQRITGRDAAQWRRWGAYVPQRVWGTTRETAPEHDNPWKRFTFDQARSRASQWMEDGIGGVCDERGTLCLTTALWNERDPILKERFFGLSNDEGVHGEDVKEVLFFLDAAPSQSYMKMLYKYPQVEFPYDRLVHENATAHKGGSSFTLLDLLRQSFAAGRYFDITIELAKAAPDDLLYQITAVNRAGEPAPLHILPQLFFRDQTWLTPGAARPLLRAQGEEVHVQHPDLDSMIWSVEGTSELLFTDNITDTALLYDSQDAPDYVKNAIDRAIVYGQRERLNPEQIGTRCAAHFRCILAPGESWSVRTRLRASTVKPDAAPDFDAVLTDRAAEAAAFYAEIQKDTPDEEERFIQHRAFAGLLWNKSVYHFTVKRWLDAYPAQPDLTSSQAALRTTWERWAHFDAHDLLSVPDGWEYPWLANWDLCFQIATICLVHPTFAQSQAQMLLSDRFMRPDGALPGFEGDLDSVHPPVIGWAVWHIYQASGHDRAFLKSCYPALKRHFAWWLNTQQPVDHLFTGGFLGKDNISLINRTDDIPKGSFLLQVDATAWLASFTLMLLSIAIELGNEDDAIRFFDTFLSIRAALPALWHEDNRMYFDVLLRPDGTRMPLRVRGLNNLLPLTAVLLLDPDRLAHLPALLARLQEYRAQQTAEQPDSSVILLALTSKNTARTLLNALFDPDEFLSSFGLRSVSRLHEAHPVSMMLDGTEQTLTYEPGPTTGEMFGANSNWRGPIWSPLNHVLIESLYVYHAAWGDTLTVHLGAQPVTLEAAAHQVIDRLIALFRHDESGRRPVQGDEALFRDDAGWRELFWFYEYFHPETGGGLGASHQNGWSSFIATLIQTRGQAVYIPGAAPDEGA